MPLVGDDVAGDRKFWQLLAAMLGVLALQAGLISLTAPHTMLVAYLFEIVIAWLACGICFWHSANEPPLARLGWALLGTGLFLWAAGISLSGWMDQTQNLSGDIAYFFDFLFFLYGVPVLLAISLPMEEDRIKIFLWLDVLQSFATACAIYVALFSSFPIGGHRAEPISASFVARTYNVENLVLAAGATLRLLAHPERKEAHRLYRVLTIFLWTYSGCAALYNHMVLTMNGQTKYYDLLVTVPFLGLIVCTLAIPTHEIEDIPSAGTPSSSKLAKSIDNASPILYTAGLFVLGVFLMRRHFYWGTALIAIALAVYGLRSTLLQMQLRSTRDGLREARDRLEVLSLTDGLTQIANRRCFDKTLQSEWDRARRLNLPLALLMIDVDYFKKLNDHYGHQCGDDCLREVARALSDAMPRRGDLLARYGGEEFAAILVNTGRDGAEAVAQRMRNKVHALRVANETKLSSFVTVSVGMSTTQPFLSSSPSALMEAADRALYIAKQNGRDRAEFLETRSDIKDVRSTVE
jgi:diguanylate cyclase (GGDEF)-like protein